MPGRARVGLVALTVVGLWLACAPAAAGDDSIPLCSSNVTPQDLVGGSPIRVQGTATTPHRWAVAFDGQVINMVGNRLDQTFATRAVTTVAREVVVVSCSGPEGERSESLSVFVEPSPGVAQEAVSSASPQAARRDGRVGWNRLWLYLGWTGVVVGMAGTGALMLREANRRA